MKRANKIRFIILAALIGCCFLVWTAVFDIEEHAGFLRATVFDVGQGDSIFVETPSGHQMLIDGGPDSRVLGRLGERMPFWDHSIDVVLLTHPHADHVTGALEILKRYDVGMIIESGVDYSTSEYEEWRARIAEKHIPVHVARAGEVIDFGDGTYFNILLPSRSYVGDSPKNVHEAMVVGKLVFASSSILFTGDAEAPLEYQLLYSGVDLASDILKVGHHGSKTSTSNLFLQAVHPRAAIISVGRKNRYGHPNQDVLERLRAFGAEVYRTDTNGSVTVMSDGHYIDIAMSPKAL